MGLEYLEDIVAFLFSLEDAIADTGSAKYSLDS
jgi:hypothetical protein